MRVMAMSTLLGREPVAREVVRTLAPQVDIFHVCFSGYQHMPDWINEYSNVKAEIDPMNMLHDTSRLTWAEQYKSAVYLLCDDDIHYPNDYVDFMSGWLDKLSNQAVISLHGRTFDCTQRVNCQWVQDELIQFPVLGAGTVAFHTEYLHFQKEDFLDSMANCDYMLALKMARTEKKGYVIPRDRQIVDFSEHPCLIGAISCQKTKKRNPYVKLLQERIRREVESILAGNSDDHANKDRPSYLDRNF